MNTEMRAWLRDHPWQADGLLALVLLAFSGSQFAAGQASAVMHAAFIAVTVLLAATVVPRRRYPVAAFATAAVIGAAQIAFGVGPGQAPVYALQPTNADLAILILLYTLAAYRPRPLSIAGLAICLLGSAAAIARWSPASGPHPTGALFGAAAGLRQIERDLHDGAQVRLAALAMTLGEIKENLEQGTDDDRTLALAGAAHQNAKDTLAELRDLARGIHPPVLDRGLGPALGILAGASAIPVSLTVSLTERPSPAIEAMAYFCAAELLANATKHSGASRVRISVCEQDSGLAMSVTDDGDGGVRLVPGGGLAGLLERVQTVDGRLGIDSPPGGPTTVTIELPRHA